MEKLAVQIILNPEVKIHGQKQENNIFILRIDDFLNKVIMNENSHLSTKEKISKVKSILATNSSESPERLEFHNEILRRQILLTQSLIEKNGNFLLDVYENLIETKQWQCKTILRPLILMNTNSSAYFKRSSGLMEQMMQSGICQYFYGEGDAQNGGS